MLKIEKTQKKFILIVAVAFLLLGTVGIALSQSTKTFAASSSSVGYVDIKLLMSQHPDTVAAQKTMQAAFEQAKQDFDAKSATMSAQEKKNYYDQLQQQLDAKQQALLAPIVDKVIAAVKDVADAKGITLVVEKTTAIAGGQDITVDVGKKILGQ